MIIERLLQGILHILSFSACLFLLVTLVTYNNYNGPIYFIETDYLKWISDLPAFTICPLTPKRHITNILKKYSKGTPITSEYINYYYGLLHPNINQYYLNFSEKFIFNYNATETTNLLMLPCEHWLAECSFNGQKFSCCQHFQQIKTRQGLCYSLNSYFSRPEQVDPILNLVVSHTHPKAVLEINVYQKFKFYVHDRKNLEFFIEQNVPQITPRTRGQIIYKIQDTMVGDSGEDLTIYQRNCFLKEQFKSKCISKCIAERQIQFCGCHHHFLYGMNNECSLIDFKCLRNIYNKTMRSQDECGCLDDCSSTEVEYVLYSIKRDFGLNKSSLTATLLKIPTERIVLTARTTFLETLVTIACLSRFFTSSSIHMVIYKLFNKFNFFNRHKLIK